MRKPGTIILASIAAITALSLLALPSLRFNFDIEQLFPRNSEAVQTYQQKVLPFESDKSFEIVGIQRNRSVFEAEYLQRIHALTLALDSLPGVKEASSLTTIQYLRINPFQAKSQRRFFDPERYQPKDSTLFYAYPDVWEKFVSADGRALAIYLELEPEADEALLELVKVELKKQDIKNFHLNGALRTESAYQQALREDMLRLGIGALILTILVILIAFRSVSGVLLPLLVIATAVCWTLGSMVLAQVPLNPMTVLIPSLVAIVGLSDSIHIMSRFRESRLRGEAVDTALRNTFQDIGQALLLTSVTTAIGFLSLLLTAIGPIRQFGLFTALGVMFAYGLARLMLPVLLKMNFPAPFLARALKPGQEKAQGLKRLTIILKNQWLILLSALAIALFSIGGMSQLKVNSLLYEEMAAGDEYSASLRFFDEQFSGIRSVNILLELEDGEASFFQPKQLHKLDSLENYLLEEYGVKSHYSLTTQIKRMNRAFHGGRPNHFNLPESSEELAAIMGFVRAEAEKVGLNELVQEEGRRLLVRAQLSDRGSFAIRQKDRALSAYLDQLFPKEQGFISTITGRSALLDQSNELIAQKLGFGLLGAVLLIALWMGFWLKSARMVLISLAVNLLPLLVVAGLLGVMGIGINLSTAVIFTVAFGIAVDDTIHFLSRFRAERSKQAEGAIRRTFVSTGRAILLTSLVLVAGFGMLLLSNFQSNNITGFFISVALLMAVFADLVLLPVLLLTCRR